VNEVVKVLQNLLKHEVREKNRFFFPRQESGIIGIISGYGLYIR